MKQFFFIITLSTIAMTSLAQNKVGIGIDSPKAQLHVKKSIRFDTLKSNNSLLPVYADGNGELFVNKINTISSFTNNTPNSIPDGLCSGMVDSIVVSGMNNIISAANISVVLNISHTWNSDLAIYIQAPNGKTLNLIENIGGSSDNFSNTTFSDYSLQNINSGTAPYSGNFLPQAGNSSNCPVSQTAGVTNFRTLGDANGKINPNGVWKLLISDVFTPDPGTLNSWNINFEPEGVTKPIELYSGSAGNGIPVTLSTSLTDVEVDANATLIIPVKSLNDIITINSTVYTDFKYTGIATAQAIQYYIKGERLGIQHMPLNSNYERVYFQNAGTGEDKRMTLNPSATFSGLLPGTYKFNVYYTYSVPSATVSVRNTTNTAIVYRSAQ